MFNACVLNREQFSAVSKTFHYLLIILEVHSCKADTEDRNLRQVAMENRFVNSQGTIAIAATPPTAVSGPSISLDCLPRCPFLYKSSKTLRYNFFRTYKLTLPVQTYIKRVNKRQLWPTPYSYIQLQSAVRKNRYYYI